jgi:hypothetical protein
MAMMTMMMRSMRVLVMVLAALLQSSCVVPQAASRASLPGETLYRERCGRCHDLVPSHAYGRREWRGVMARMQSEANLSDAEVKSIMAWLESEE